MSSLRQELRGAAAALAYFTRIPCGVRLEVDDLRRAITWFPVVGILVGGFAAVVWRLGLQIWPPSVAAGLSLLAGVLLTGGMHEDGLADSCDGFGGGTNRERVLAIMQDSRIGTFGVLGLVLVLGLKWQALATLSPWSLPCLLVAAHALSRGAAATVMAWLPYARAEGEASKARPVVRQLGGLRLVVVIATSLAPLLTLPRWSWVAAGACFAVAACLSLYFRRRIGGYTGDCLGAVQQVTELLFLLTALAVT